jgi:hypothetical protein
MGSSTRGPHGDLCAWWDIITPPAFFVRMCGAVVRHGSIEDGYFIIPGVKR